jgi:hypothetical protein
MDLLKMIGGFIPKQMFSRKSRTTRHSTKTKKSKKINRRTKRRNTV